MQATGVADISRFGGEDVVIRLNPLLPGKGKAPGVCRGPFCSVSDHRSVLGVWKQAHTYPHTLTSRPATRARDYVNECHH